jgi:Asp-tRNA(Asn)/Glu-tRNA(Gln) amidotransferase A subunit family amidase
MPQAKTRTIDPVGPISGLAVLADIAKGHLSQTEAFDRFANRAAALEPQLGCFTCHDFQRARTAAITAIGPLHGLPIGVKDIIETYDFPTQHGSPIYAGFQSVADAPVVSLIRRAGGTVPGKTVTTEFAYFLPRGTKNPHDLTRSPGGSSSGSAAAVAAGMLPFALGTQTGGSILRPASYCGIAGYKPTFGLLPTGGVKPFSISLDTVGTFGATVADAAFLAEAITQRTLVPSGDAPQQLQHWRIGLCSDYMAGETHQDMRLALEDTAAALTNMGTDLAPLSLPKIVQDAGEHHQIIQNFEAARALAHEFDRHRHQMSPVLVETLEHGHQISIVEYDKARKLVKRARLALLDVFQNVDAILMPSATSIAPHLSEHSTGRPVFNRLWTLMGNPTVNIPGQSDPNGIPLGMQIIGGAADDQRTLNIASLVESAIAKR